MHKRWDILGIGTAAVDDLVLLEGFPQPDAKMPYQAVQRHGGGQTATALVAAARHGARTAFFACLGEDALSLFSIRALEAEAVDCSLVLRAPDCRPVHSLILVDRTTGSRSILYNLNGVREPPPDTVDPAWIAASRVIFFDQNAPRAGLQAARLAKPLNIPVVADLEKLDLPEMEEILAHIDHLIVSTDFARRLTGHETPEAMLRALTHPRQAACVVTWGSQGCWYTEAGGAVTHLPAFQVPVVDTTGCGDVFHGAYAAALARAESVPQAVRIASATAALKASQPGGRTGIPNLPTVLNFL
jgi:sulfofructose kinase